VGGRVEIKLQNVCKSCKTKRNFNETGIGHCIKRSTMNLLSKLNNKAVHGDYQGSGHNLVVITSFFLLDELKLIKAMI
jgi:hypothetical protein